MPQRIIIFSEYISTFFSLFLMLSFPTILSVIASAMAIIWWIIKFYEKYKTAIVNKIKDWRKK